MVNKKAFQHVSKLQAHAMDQVAELSSITG